MSRRYLWLIAPILMLLLLAVIELTRPEPPAAVEQLTQAQEAASEAEEGSLKITESLEAIAENLGEGARLSESSDEIHDLTTRQRRSLENLVDVLEEQLSVLRDTDEALTRTQGSADEVAELSKRQAALVAEAVKALRRLEEAARDAGSFSGRVAILARYAARLAEDSARAFSSP